MNKKIIFWTGALFLSSFLLLILLIKAADNPNIHKNGFIRNWLLAKPMQSDYQLTLSDYLTGFAGNTKNRVFFAGQSPDILIATDFNLNKIDTLLFRIPLTPKMKLGFDEIIDSPTLFVYSRNEGAVLKYTQGDSNAILRKLPSRLFTRIATLQSGNIVLRAFDSSGMKQVFQKIDMSRNIVTAQTRDDIMGKQTDAGFSTDGLLHYDSSSQRLIYVQYYQNHFLCMDTNLNLVYTGQTIDTMRTNFVQVRNSADVEKKPGGSIMPSTPLKPVSQASCVYKGMIFILSAVQADNEITENISKNSVIDVYRIKDGKYEGSFYIPKTDGKEPFEIRIIYDHLYALYANQIAAFSLSNASLFIKN